MGREIRANPMSFLGGYPLCGGLALFIEGPFSCYNVCFLFKDANCALHSLFRNKENPHVLCFSYLERWVKIGWPIYTSQRSHSDAVLYIGCMSHMSYAYSPTPSPTPLRLWSYTLQPDLGSPYRSQSVLLIRCV